MAEVQDDIIIVSEIDKIYDYYWDNDAVNDDSVTSPIADPTNWGSYIDTFFTKPTVTPEYNIGTSDVSTHSTQETTPSDVDHYSYYKNWYKYIPSNYAHTDYDNAFISADTMIKNSAISSHLISDNSPKSSYHYYHMTPYYSSTLTSPFSALYTDLSKVNSHTHYKSLIQMIWKDCSPDAVTKVDESISNTPNAYETGITKHILNWLNGMATSYIFPSDDIHIKNDDFLSIKPKQHRKHTNFDKEPITYTVESKKNKKNNKTKKLTYIKVKQSKYTGNKLPKKFKASFR